MKVIEHIKNNRTGEVNEVSWGNKIADDMSVISSVASIIRDQRDREKGGYSNPALEGRFTTVSITIEL